MDEALGKRIIALRQRIVASFDAMNWDDVGLLSGHYEAIKSHPRLLQSLYFGDGDYSECVASVLLKVAGESLMAFPTFCLLPATEAAERVARKGGRRR